MRTIHLCLSDEVMYNVMNEESPLKMWKKLEDLYIEKYLTNKLFVNKKKTFRVTDEGFDVLEHMKSFTKVYKDLLRLGTTIKDENKAVLLLASLLTSYNHLITTLLCGNITMNLEEINTTLISNKIRKKAMMTLR